MELNSPLNSYKIISLITVIFPLLILNCGGSGGGNSGGNSSGTEEGTISLAWDASTQDDVVGYRVYYGLSSGVYENHSEVPNRGSETVTYRLSNLVKGQTYFIAVTARNSGYDESNFSNEVSAVAR